MRNNKCNKCSKEFKTYYFSHDLCTSCKDRSLWEEAWSLQGRNNIPVEYIKDYQNNEVGKIYGNN